MQYLALKTSTPLNVTLVAASSPVWMLGIGALFFGQRVSQRQLAGAVLSIAGVLLVLSRGDWQQLAQVRLVPGDLYVLLATAAWAFYSWLLIRPGDPPEIRGNWAAFLMAQIVFGLGWSALFAGGEWATGNTHIEWGWPLAAALAYVAIGPAILAYRCWGMGVARVGPNIAGFFANLTPLFAAVMSAAFLGELPRIYHAVAFVLIVGGIVVSSRRGDLALGRLLPCRGECRSYPRRMRDGIHRAITFGGQRRRHHRVATGSQQVIARDQPRHEGAAESVPRARGIDRPARMRCEAMTLVCVRHQGAAFTELQGHDLRAQ